MIQSTILVVHLVLAVLIIVVVLLQSGKGATAGTGFGAGASGTVFGARGSASFLTRMTAVMATLFFITSLALAYLVNQDRTPTSLLDRVPVQQTAPAPTTGSAAAGGTDAAVVAAPAGKSDAGADALAPAPAAKKSADNTAPSTPGGSSRK